MFMKVGLEEISRASRWEWVTLVESSLEHAMNWGQGNGEEEASQHKRHGTQNGEGFPFDPGERVVFARHVLESSPVVMRPPRKF